ncbi:MAG: ComEC/Rec2 family competence protein [Fuerstiella sp.]|nr:ComEC/Rec2 family competence protein [Fuerstiella sp.]
MNFGSQPVHRIAATVLALSLGTVSAEFLEMSPTVCLLIAWGLFFAGMISGRMRWISFRQRRQLRLLSLVLTVATLSAVRWTLVLQENSACPVHRLAQQDNLSLVMDVVITSVPVEYERPLSKLASQRETGRRQTGFIAECVTIHTAEERIPADGTLRVYISGGAARRFRRGETVRMTGRLSWPAPPGNPGEFDFATFLSRRRYAGIFFAAHPDCVRTLHKVGPASAGYWLTWLRRAAESALHDAVDPEHREIASALLLGSRAEIRAETNEIFIGSGTMHLLAISGLHIGIFCLLLIRMGHWLLIPWNQRLILIAVFCVVYALITDLRPSVVRATVFSALFTMSQITLRQVPVSCVIGQTACLMLLWHPYLVFDTGAWLSFLSVTGLTWASRIVPLEVLRSKIGTFSAEPAAPLTPRERLRDVVMRIRHWLSSRYRPLLWIMAATIPLTAWEFHVISPIGLLVNVLLIAWTMVTLWLGFASIIAGILLPWLPNLAGTGFSLMLGGLTSMVRAAADIGFGHVYIANLPVWFLPMWYTVLIAVVSVRETQHKRILWLILCGSTSVALWNHTNSNIDAGLRCTFLAIGHGNATVVELPGGKVMLVDAGAMNRGDRAGEQISRFLWQRGHRMIDSVIVSHADTDHFNALGTLLTRFPTGELLLSQQFIQNGSAAAEQLIRLAADSRVPVRPAGHGDSLTMDDTEIRILQASRDHLRNARSNNEKSLVVRIRYKGRTVVLPGDLEGDALKNILPQLSHSDVLASPHHGSLKANVPAVADQLTPEHVVISARNDRNRPQLDRIFPGSRLHFTSVHGAIELEITATGKLSVREFRPSTP